MESENTPVSKKRPAPEKPVPRPVVDGTPTWLVDFVLSDFPVTSYPATGLENPLRDAWTGFSFAHPPHADAEVWAKKAVREAKNGNHSVLLLPAVFNSVYWREVIYKDASEIRVLVCPVKRPGAKKQIVSQMSLVVFAGRTEEEQGLMPPIYAVEPEGWKDHYYIRERNRARFSAD